MLRRPSQVESKRKKIVKADIRVARSKAKQNDFLLHGQRQQSFVSRFTVLVVYSKRPKVGDSKNYYEAEIINNLIIFSHIY